MRQQEDHDGERRPGMRLAAGLTVLAFALLIAAAGLAFWADHQFKANAMSVRQSMLAKQMALSFLSQAKDAEIGQRGYLLTGRADYLQPYTSAVASVRGSLDRLGNLVIDPATQKNVLTLQRILEAKLGELDQTIGLYRNGEREAAIALMRSGAGKDEMDRMRSLIGTIIASQDTILDARLDGLERWSALGRSAIVTLLVLVMLLGLLIARSMKAHWDEQAEGGRRIAALNAELEDRVRRRTAEVEAASTEAKAERGRAEFERQRVETLLQDMNHRVGNNLSMVSALLGMQIAASPDAEVRKALRAASTRIATIGAAQRRMRLTNDLVGTRLDQLLGEVVADIGAVSFREGVGLHLHLARAVVDSRDAISVSTILSELIVNALKHGYPDGRRGRIDIHFEPLGNGARLTVVDDGIGFAPGQRVTATGGLGTRIIDRLASQYGGSVAIASRPGEGARTTVDLPGLSVRPAGADEARAESDDETEAGAGAGDETGDGDAGVAGKACGRTEDSGVIKG